MKIDSISVLLKRESKLVDEYNDLQDTLAYWKDKIESNKDFAMEQIKKTSAEISEKEEEISNLRKEIYYRLKEGELHS